MGGDEEIAALYEAQREALKGLARAQKDVARSSPPARRDFPGLENDPDCLIPIRESWARWLEEKQKARISD